MKKLTQALLLALFVAAPAAIAAPQAQAKMVTSQQQAVKASSNQQLAANTAGTKAMSRKARLRNKKTRTTSLRKSLNKGTTTPSVK